MERISMGPVGGNGGKPFENYDIPDDARVTAVHVFAEWVVNAVQLEYVQSDGRGGGRPPIGGLGGQHFVFTLEEDEYLTGISGYAGWYVDSVCFHTNKRMSPLFGGAGGEREFSFDAPPGHEIAGLFGRSDWHIDALGINLRPLAARPEPAAGTDELEADDSDHAPWMEIVSQGEPIDASVALRRRKINSQEELDALEDEAVAEAIAAFESREEGEGVVDVAVYTQVSGDEAGDETVAVVMAVAAETENLELVGDDLVETAVMVVDDIANEDDIAALEAEAAEGAVEALQEEMGESEDDLDITIYTGVSEEDGQNYAAVVAIATKVAAPPAASAPETPAKGEKRPPRLKDLERVEGIGPKIAELLVEHNIHDLADLAAAPVERLREILAGAGRRFRLADPTTWPEQAALGAKGLWDDLAALQTRLKGGR
jgi:predicted flap endonuclease-1-like 5' DNA nuclease